MTMLFGTIYCEPSQTTTEIELKSASVIACDPITLNVKGETNAKEKETTQQRWVKWQRSYIVVKTN